jgi:hypothetical protein
LIHRLPAPFVRHLLAHHRAQHLLARATAAELGLGRTRFYELYSDYLRACARGQADTWSPGPSGGDHHADWPAQVTALLTQLLSSKPPSSYSAAASELHRRLKFATDRASVRRWAIENQLAPDTRYQAPPQPVKRWQARDYGALWQYDASPHAWLPGSPDKQVLLDLLDDATRYNTGARLYPRETLLAHFDFLARAFQTHGLPLALYVDYPSFFYTHNPDAFTQLGAALHCYGVALRYAPTPGRPRAKSNADITTGKNACPRSWPPTTSSNWTAPTTCSTNWCPTPTSTRSIANSAPRRSSPATRP